MQMDPICRNRVVLSVLWRVPKLERPRLAALGSWLETARWWYRRLFCVNGKTIAPDGILFLRGVGFALC